MDRYVAAITWLRAWKVYWAHLWRTFLVFLALTVVAMLTYGLVGPVLRLAIGVGESILRLALVVAILSYAGAWSMRRALQATYADFSIAVVSVDPAGAANSPTVATLTLRHSLAVWWAAFWRAMLLTIPLNFLSNYLITGAALPGMNTGTAELVALYTVQTAFSFATGTWAVRMALPLHYGTWRLELVSAVQTRLSPIAPTATTTGPATDSAAQ